MITRLFCSALVLLSLLSLGANRGAAAPAVDAVRVVGDFDDLEARYVRVGYPDETIGVFHVISPEASVDLSVMAFQVSSSNVGDRVSRLTAISLYDDNGSLVAGPVDAVGASATGSITFAEPITLPAGTHRYTLRADIGSSYGHLRSITVSTIPSSDWLDGATAIPGITSGLVSAPPVKTKTVGPWRFAREVGLITSWSTCIPHTPDNSTPDPECPGGKRRWTPEEVARAMHRYPNHYLGTGNIPPVPGSTALTELGDMIDALQARGAELGVDLSKITINYRVDVFIKFDKIDARNCVLIGQSCPWEGDMDGSKGDGPFDTGWIARVPKSVHDQIVDQFWAGRDPSDAANWGPISYQDFVDEDAILALPADPTERLTQRIALYGSGFIWGGAPRMKVNDVIMDVRIPAYRTWQVKKFLYVLEDMGLDPGEPFALAIANKPGWNTFFDSTAETNTADPCWVGQLSDGTPVNRWSPITHDCAQDPKILSQIGPYHPNIYGPGEFGAAYEAFLVELREAVVAAGYPEFEIVTIERPDFRDEKWSSFSDDFLANEPVVGGWQSSAKPDVYHLRMTSPVDQSTLALPTQRFEWFEDFRVEQYRLDVASSAAILEGGGPGDVYSNPDVPAEGIDDVPIPLNGAPLYVRLGYKINGSWLEEDYSYGTDFIPDTDADGVVDDFDNCMDVANPSPQRDSNADGFGNRCDPDLNDDGQVGGPDFAIFRAAYGSEAGQPGFDGDADFDGDETIGPDDLAIFMSYFGGPPGPAGARVASEAATGPPQAVD